MTDRRIRPPRDRVLIGRFAGRSARIFFAVLIPNSPIGLFALVVSGGILADALRGSALLLSIVFLAGLIYAQMYYSYKSRRSVGGCQGSRYTPR